MTETRGGATGADTGPHGRLCGAKDIDEANWAHKYCGPRGHDKGAY